MTGRRPLGVPLRARALPAQPPDRSPRTAGPQPRDVLRLALPDRSPRTAGPQPRDVLRLALPDRSPRTAGPQPRDVLRLAPPDRSPRTAGPQPPDGLRLALRPGGRPRKGGEAPLRAPQCPSSSLSP